MKNWINYSPVSLSSRSAALIIKSYRTFFSPDHGIFGPVFGYSRCRFYPSCSEYTLNALRQYGLFKGGVVSLKRIVRCNPLNPGGYDPRFKSEARNPKS